MERSFLQLHRSWILFWIVVRVKERGRGFHSEVTVKHPFLLLRCLNGRQLTTASQLLQFIRNLVWFLKVDVTAVEVLLKQFCDLTTSLTGEFTRGSKYDVSVFRLTCSQQLFPSIFAFRYLYIDCVCTPPGNCCIPLRLWHVTQSTASGHTAAVDPRADILGTQSRLQISPHFPTPSPDSLSLRVLVTVCSQLSAAACYQRQVQPHCTHAAS